MVSANQLAAGLTEGVSALVVGAKGTAELLDDAATQLAAGRTRVLRVRPPYSLLDFMDQVSGNGRATGDAGLAQGFRTLTHPDASCDRIALLAADAHLMPHATLRYIELALRAGPDLHVALAGPPGFADHLGFVGFSELCKRLRLPIVVAAPTPRRVATRRRTLIRRSAVAVVTMFAVWAPRPTATPMVELERPGPGYASLPSPVASAPPEVPPPLEAPEPSLSPMPVAKPTLPIVWAAPRLPSPRPEALAARLPAAKQNKQRCRDITQHVQFGENLTDDDQTFLRNGCR